MKILSTKDGIIERTTEPTVVALRDAASGEPYETTLLLAYHGWPTAVMDEDGTLYVAASGNRLGHVDPFGETCLYVSRDEGGTWEKSVVNSSVESGLFIDHRDTGLLYLGSGRMVLTYFTHNSKCYSEGPDKLWIEWKELVNQADSRNADAISEAWRENPWYSGSYVQFSNDYGKTWSEPQTVEVSSPHGPTLLSDGTLLYVGRYCAEIASQRGTIFYDEKGNITAISWSKRERIALSIDYCTENEEILLCEPHAIELKSGRILVAIRVQNSIEGKARHSERCYTGFCVYEAYSDDHGKTWTVLSRLRLAGSPPHLLEVAPNTVVMTVAERWNNSPDHPAITGEYGYISYDGGETWSDEFTVSKGPNGDCGYPATLTLSENGNRRRMFTAYYQNDGITTNLLYTVWEIEL